MIVIGITGGICCGKSTVISILAEKYGIKVIDADKLGHAAYVPGTSCCNALIANFGDEIKADDGGINRKALGGIVFSSSEKMKELQSIVWPEIRRMLEDSIRESREQGAKFIVIEAAVMLEAGWQDMMDEVWVVVVPPEQALERLVVRNSLSAEEAQKRIDAQMSNESRIAYATLVLENTGTKGNLEEKIGERMSALER
jgi:phosphopantetheine adenylyltransferase/dephospho-CoA kinase